MPGSCHCLVVRQHKEEEKEEEEQLLVTTSLALLLFDTCSPPSPAGRKSRIQRRAPVLGTDCGMRGDGTRRVGNVLV